MEEKGIANPSGDLETMEPDFYQKNLYACPEARKRNKKTEERVSKDFPRFLLWFRASIAESVLIERNGNVCYCCHAEYDNFFLFRGRRVINVE